MKIATIRYREKVKACANAPQKALCPYCKGVVFLRSRRRSNQPGDVTYLWRHENFTNPNCLARFRYDMIK